MLYNVSYNNPKIKQLINDALGKPFTFKECFKMRGIGSSKLWITEASKNMEDLLNLDSNNNTCNIEIRPNGIIIGFRSLLESYAFIIPYWKLNIYKGKSEEYSFYNDVNFIKIRAKAKDKATHKFVKKIIDYKVSQLPNTINS